MIYFINGDLVRADWKYATHVFVGSYGEVYRADCNGTVSPFSTSIVFFNVLLLFYLISS